MAFESRLPSNWCNRVGSPKIGTSSPGSNVSTMPATVAEVWMAWTASSARRCRSKVDEGDPEPATGAGIGQEVLGDGLELFGVALNGLEHPDLALGQVHGGRRGAVPRSPGWR